MHFRLFKIIDHFLLSMPLEKFIPLSIVAVIMCFCILKMTFNFKFFKLKPVRFVGHILSVIFTYLLQRIAYIFTDRFAIEDSKYEAELKYEKLFKNKIQDLQNEIYLLEDIVKNNKKAKSLSSQTSSDNEDFWRGVKYGYSLSKKKENESSKSIEITSSHIFALFEIYKGNSSVNGVVPAFLEDVGYVRLIWDDIEKTRYHYELTKKGLSVIKKENKKNKTA